MNIHVGVRAFLFALLRICDARDVLRNRCTRLSYEYVSCVCVCVHLHLHPVGSDAYEHRMCYVVLRIPDGRVITLMLSVERCKFDGLVAREANGKRIRREVFVVFLLTPNPY